MKFTSSAHLTGGGTVSGDLTIDGDLTVKGSASNSYDEIIEGNLQVGNSTTADSTIVIESSSSGDPKLQFTSTSNRDVIIDFAEGSTLQGAIVYKHNGDTLGFSTGSTNRAERFVVNETSSYFTSKLGIGTDSPTRQLTLAGAGSAILLDSSDHAYIELDRGGADDLAQLKFMTAGSALWYAGMADSGSTGFDGTEFFIGEGSGASANAHLVIDASGNVGIGTASPAFTVGNGLEIEKDGAATLRLTDTGSGSKVFEVYIDDSTGAVLNSQGSALSMIFKTTGSERMRIASAGNVGIGTSTPSSFDSEANNLVVGTGSGDNGITIYTGSSAGHHGSIFFGDATGTPKQGQIRYEQNNEVMSFFTNTAERMRIDASGNVGIGTDSPSELLHVKKSTGDVGLTIESVASGTSPKLRIKSPADRISAIEFYEGGSLKSSIWHSTDDSLNFNVNSGGDNALSIASNKNATFAGDISVPATNKLRLDGASGHSYIYEHSNDDVRVYVGGTAVWDFLTTGAGVSATGKLHLDGGGDTYIQESSANVLKVFTGGTQALEINASQNATFAGDVTTSKANATGNSIILQQSLGSLASPSTSANTNILGKIQFVGKSSNDTPVGAEIKSVITASVGSTKNMPSSLVFSTQPSGGADLATALTIDSSQIATFASSIFGPSGFTLNWSSANTRIGGSHSNKNLYFDIDTGGTVFKLDHNSRISLSNNDSSGAVGTTLFGYRAGLSVPNGAIQNTFIGHDVAIATITDAADYNTAVGAFSMSALTSGTQNTAHGMNSLLRVTSGNFNTAIGVASLEDITTTSNNTAVGRQSGFYSVGADNTYIGYQSGLGSDGSGADNYNTAVGSQSLKAITTGDNNTAIGYNSLDAGTDAHDNTAIGFASLGSAVSVGYAVAIGNESMNNGNVTSSADGAVGIGYKSLYDLTSGAENTAIGYNSGLIISTGGENTLLGYSAGKGFDTNSGNTAMGASAMSGAGDASYCVAIGMQSLDASLTSGANGAVAIGTSSLGALTSGASNTAVGYQSADNITTGSRNTVLGYQSMYQAGGDANKAPSADDNIAIGYRSMGGQWNGGADAPDKNIAIGNYSLDAILNHALDNIAIGYNSLTELTGGDNNLAVGNYSGDTLTTGDFCTIVGNTSDVSADAQNQTVIGYGATGVADNSVSLGNASVTDVYMAQDSGAVVHSGALVNGLSAVLVTTSTLAYDTHTISKSKYVTVSADAQTITLPAVQIGAVFIIVNIAADGGALLTIEPNADDKFLTDIAGSVGTNDKGIINTKATQNQGDFIKLVGLNEDGWLIDSISGIWVDEA